jgi:4'-phosphopantetheinyl transferase
MNLAPGEIHVWHVDLDHWVGEDVLSPEEQQRANRFYAPLHRRRQVATRNVVRSLLGRYAGRPPRSLRFATGTHGKPALVDAGDLEFNLSHSEAELVVAASRGAPVGVDVERTTRPAPHEVNGTVFCTEECRQLDALAGPARDALFYRLWTRKEALLKGRGDGFVTDPRTLNVLDDPPAPGWYLHELRNFVSGADVVIATPLAEARVQRFRWER